MNNRRETSRSRLGAVANVSFFGSSSPSPFHSSFGPTPTAATVTPAAASGTTAAPASSTASASTSATMSTTTTSTFTAPTVPAIAPIALTPTALTTPTFVANNTPVATPSFSLGYSTLPIFGSTPSTTTTTATTAVNATSPSIGTTAGIFGSTASPHIFGATTPLFSPLQIDDSSSSKSANTVPIEVIKSLRFRFEWPHADVTREKMYSRAYRSKVDGTQFRCLVKMVENCFLFHILCQSQKDFEGMQWVSTGIIQSTDRLVEISSVASPWPMSRMISISGPILMSRFTLNSGSYSVEITLSHDPSFVRTPAPSSPTTNTHCDNILGKMLRDSSTYDVFFEFETPIALYDCEPIQGEEKGFVEIKKEEASEPIVKSEKGEETKENASSSPLITNEDETAETSATTIWDKVGAHKIVLSQFDYFKTMFSSSFAEGGPGVKTIKIKDTDIQCFRLLIEYLYLGRLGLFSVPRTLTEDDAKDSLPTWEDVYLIADRYSIVDLRRMAASRILSGLSTTWALPFLFRTAYLFDDLRLPVITFVSQNSMEEIVGKDALAKYYDHPECGSIMADLLAALWKFKAEQPSLTPIVSPTRKVAVASRGIPLPSRPPV
ncbi:hypothetical protein BGX21_008521 [Mortierella sp. AD011]|nr:hypothetical protein BGX20_000967 [Mortierella sp. AD010]KAF9397775.1 hypothetical protein BGX21_008521 [Mortierella sp. AD011]